MSVFRYGLVGPNFGLKVTLKLVPQVERKGNRLIFLYLLRKRKPKGRKRYFFRMLFFGWL